MKIDKRLAILLVQAWQKNLKMIEVIRQYADLPRNGDYPPGAFSKAMEAAGIPRIDLTMRSRVFVSAYFMAANNALWDKRPVTAMRWMISGKDTDRLYKRKGKPSSVDMIIKVRERDKTHDWKTVK